MRNSLTTHYPQLRRMPNIRHINSDLCTINKRASFGFTYTKIGTIQRRLAWPLRKDDTQIREAFQIFALPFSRLHSNTRTVSINCSCAAQVAPGVSNTVAKKLSTPELDTNSDNSMLSAVTALWIF